jgi:hypothetical protein
MSRRRGRQWREQRAVLRARKRRDNGDPLPYMVILKQERDRLNIIAPVDKSRKVVNIFGPGGTL